MIEGRKEKEGKEGEGEEEGKREKKGGEGGKEQY